MANRKFGNVIKTCFKVFDYFFFAISILTLFFTISFVLITFAELYKLYGFNIEFSKEGFKRFFLAFAWCEGYIKAGFIVFPIYFALSTYRVHEANKRNNEDTYFRNNHLKPQIEIINNKLALIKDKNKKMFDHITLFEEKITKDIMQNEIKGEIKSKRILEKYFNKYITEHLNLFEDCGYWYVDYCKVESATCLGNKCVKGCCKPSHIGIPHSLDSFKEISKELFCISSEYTNFERDIEEIYKNTLK